MTVNRREFLHMLSMAVAAGILPACGNSSNVRNATQAIYNKPIKENSVRLLHFTDCHAQLEPIYFREPNVNIGLHSAKDRPPHLVGKNLLDYYGIGNNSPLSYAFTYLNFEQAALRYGKVGGFSHLKTLIDQLRSGFGEDKTLLMDGGDTWQGSGTALWTKGDDMVQACNMLGVDVMTGHWEFTYPEEVVRKNFNNFNGEFIAQNISLTDDAVFEGAEVFNEETGHAFKPYTMKELGGHRIAVIGQAFPYTPIANPKRFIKNWTFGIQPESLQILIDNIKANEKPAAIILLSHNGMDVDVKLASIVSGIDAIFGGHTHDGIPQPLKVKNAGGVTLVTNAGSNGKFVGCMDFSIKNGQVQNFDYHLYPVFSNLLPEDKKMRALIDGVRKPYLEKLNEPLAVTHDLLYRRGNFNGTFDQIICDALRDVKGADIALSPGFRWGTSVLPSQTITMDRVLDQTCINYPETYVSEMTGETIKIILEDVMDNLFNPDPFYQQGGDMVRVGGMNYVCNLAAPAGKRIVDMHMDNGKKVEASKTYKVAGWATVNSVAPDEPIWDTVATYLRDKKEVQITKFNTPKIQNIPANKGIAAY